MLLPATRRDLERAIREKVGVASEEALTWFEVRAKVGSKTGTDGLLGLCVGQVAFASRTLTGEESFHLWRSGDLTSIESEHSAFDERLKLQTTNGIVLLERLSAQNAKALLEALTRSVMVAASAPAETGGAATELAPGQIVCSSCGNINEQHYMFCAQCGRDLGAERAIDGVPEGSEMLELIVTMEPTAEALPPEQRPGAFRCPRCRHPCAAHAVFCVACGLDLTAGTITRPPRKGDDAALPAPTPHLDPVKRVPEKCPTCGEAVASHYAVCRSCGAVVKPLSVTGSRPELVEKPRLKAVVGPYAGQMFPLPDRKIIIGRSEASDIAIEADDVSRSHAVLAPERGKWRVSDLSSANGTKVNGRIVVAPTELAHGDRVRVGLEHEFRFLVGVDDTSEPEPEPKPQAPSGPPPRRRSGRRRRKEPSMALMAAVVIAVVVVVLVLVALASR